MATNTIRRVAAAGALAVAALTGPALAALSFDTTSTAQGKCLAWVGSRDDGQCIGWSNGSPTYIGTPDGYLFPGYNRNVPGSIATGPLMPGQTINVPIGGQ